MGDQRQIPTTTMAVIDICLCLLHARIASGRPRAYAETRANACVRHLSEVRVGVQEPEVEYARRVSATHCPCACCASESYVSASSSWRIMAALSMAGTDASTRIWSENGNRQGVQCKDIWPPALTRLTVCAGKG